MEIKFSKEYNSEKMVMLPWCNWKTELQMELDEICDVELKYVGYSTGRSAINFKFEDMNINKNCVYVCGIKAMDDFMKLPKQMTNDYDFKGNIKFKKKGTVILFDFV